MKRLSIPGWSRSLIPALLFSSIAYGQGATTNNNILYNKAPQISSPNAAALEKYVEFPTATYTGVPDISIPLYNIGIKGVQVPIGLSYHASGIKVDEISSDVGIGWSLIAGGAVSILPNGLMDEVSGFPNIGTGNYDKIKNNTLQPGYTGGLIPCATASIYNDPLTDPDPYGLYSGGDITLLGGVIRETHDTEPDIYSFQFPGKSGKFFLDESGVFRTIPYSEVKIERIIISSLPAGYKITDELGNVFEFGVREESTEMQANAANSLHPSQKTTRTYYLSKITNVYSETIDFYYSTYNYTYNLQNTFSRSRTSSLSSCWQMNTSGGYFNNSWTYGTMTVVGQRIDSIRVSDGTLINFGYSSTNRTDLPGTKALAKIELWQYLFGRQKIRETTLTQGYSGGRMILNSVQETGKPATSFTYNGTLPTRLSYSQDHYGYYNGKMNSTLLPADEYMEFPDGADRSVVPAYTQDGILTKINHPTGGFTEYIYEPNNYYVSTNTTKYVKTIGATKVSLPDQTVSAVFTVPSNASNIRITHTDSYDGSQIHNDYCIIHLTGPNGYSQDFVGNSQPNTPFLTLSPGQYTLSIENVGSTYSAEATITWFESTQVAPHHELGGGVRIKEIRKYESDLTLSLVKKFEYNQAGSSESSGSPTNMPIYISYADQTINKQGDASNLSCSSIPCQLIMQSSNSVSPVFFANGSSVLYKEVTTYIKDKTQNGYTYYKFNISDYGFNMGTPSFPYAPRIPYDWVDGSLLEQHEYAYDNSQYILVKKLKNYYNYDQFNPAVNTTDLYAAYGTKIGIVNPPFICHSECLAVPITASLSSIYFGLQPYKLYSSFYKLTKTETTEYSLTGTQPFTTVTEYFNDNANSIQVNRIETKNSKGETLIQRLKYPKDYSSYGFVQYLLSKNVLAIPVEKYQVLKDAASNQFITGGEITTFKSNSVLPDKTYSYEAGERVAIGSFTASTMNSSGQLVMDTKYKEKNSFNAYNSIGNITELQKKDDVKETYLWGYNKTQPVAHVTGADYSTVAAFISQSILDNVGGDYSDAQIRTELNKIRTGLAGTLAFVTTYTYKPLVGMTSQTDPNGRTTYYEYDALGRLALVRDQDNNILKKICYNYYGQQEDCGVIVYTSVAKSGSFTRNNCGTNGTGSSVTYTVAAGAYTSTISQADADQKAQNDVNTNGQGYANANAGCTWTNQAQSGNFTRNNCGTNGTGGTVTYTIAANTYNSTISLADANQQAINAVNAGGQNYANANAGCTWYNQAMSQNFTRNNCPANYTGGTVAYSVAANTYSSTVSLAAANQLAQNDINANGQTYANTNASCISNCNSGNCGGQNQKCINGVCENGVKVYTSSTYDGTVYTCVYHYEFSDGSWSTNYIEYSSFNCMGGGGSEG